MTLPDLIHLTAEENLPSIREVGGLMCLKELDRLGIRPITASSSGSQIGDRRRGLDRYVHLALTQRNWMIQAVLREGRLKNPVILAVDADIWSHPEGRWCPGNANQKGAKTYPIQTLRDQLSGELPELWEDRAACEVLVPETVPIALLTMDGVPITEIAKSALPEEEELPPAEVLPGERIIHRGFRPNRHGIIKRVSEGTDRVSILLVPERTPRHFRLSMVRKWLVKGPRT